ERWITTKISFANNMNLTTQKPLLSKKVLKTYKLSKKNFSTKDYFILNSLSQCKTKIAQVQFTINSNPEVSLYVDNISYGETDKHGILSTSNYFCLNQTYKVDLRHNRCNSLSKKFKVTREEDTFEYMKKLC
ncbi:hypothetical protein, partial [Piscirickettsia litoralis]|uniref:hypothetical protein n=1 Tax=Piscirickettsia litoralis TaxID=1891921 RepID=UPI001F23128F